MKKWIACFGIPWGVPFALVALAGPLPAQNLGMVCDNDASESVFVFDADADTILGEVFVGEPHDCEMLDNQTLGFVAGWDTGIWVIDLTASPPALLVHANNPIATSTEFNENLVITRDQKYLLVCDGSLRRPISVIDIATLTEIDDVDTGEEHLSIAICDDGSVLSTTDFPPPAGSGGVRRFELDGAGDLTDTGELVAFFGARYSVFSPTCNFAVVNGANVSPFQFQMRSYASPGLAFVDSRVAPGEVVCALMHPGADLYYARVGSPGQIVLWQYNHSTGSFVGSSPLATRSLGSVNFYFGVDQMDLHPDRTKLYAVDRQNKLVRILDPITLGDTTLGGPVTLPLPASFTEPAGICMRTTSDPLAVDLKYFKARRTPDGEVRIIWGTASEIENAGFQLYRQEWTPSPTGTPTDAASLVHRNLIPARGSPFQATPYRWVDEAAQPGQAYHYWLVDIDLHGQSTTHGPIAVR